MTKLVKASFLALLFVAFAPHGAEKSLQHTQTFTFCDMGLHPGGGRQVAGSAARAFTPGMRVRRNLA